MNQTKPPPEKAALRASIRAARDAFVGGSGRALTAPAQFLKLLRHGVTVTSYVPVGNEANPSLLVEAAVAAGCSVALPHVTTRTAPMRFLAWMPTDELHDGPFKLRQPHVGSPVVSPDIILTPLIAFDAKLDRLGQGAGYYDRAFEAYPDALRIGVAWSVQQVETVPTDAWDMPLHAVITEHGWIARPMEPAE